MPLAFQNIPIVFTRGLNTKSDPKTTVPGDLLELDNAVFTTIGTLTKRYGTRALSREIEGSASTIASGSALATHGDALLMFGGNHVYSHSPATGRWIDRGVARSVIAGTDTVIRNTYQQSNPDVAESYGIRVVAWEDSRGGVRCSVMDAATGELFQSDVSLHSTAVRPRVIAFANEFLVFYALGSNIYYRRINKNTPSTLGAQINPIATAHAVNSHFDAYAVGARLFVAYNDSADDIVVSYLDSTFGVIFTTAGVAPIGGTPTCITVFSDRFDNVIVGYGTTVNAEIMSWSYSLGTMHAQTLLQALSPVRITGGFVEGYGDLSLVFYEIAGAAPDLARIRLSGVDDSWASIGTFHVARGVGLAGRMVVDDSEPIVYAVCVHESALQSTYFLISDDQKVTARVLPGVAGGLRSNSQVSAMITYADGKMLFAVQRKTELVTESGTTYTLKGISTIDLDLSTADRFRHAQSAGVTHVVGGALQMYDGRAMVEHGFHLYPEGVTTAVAAGVGFLSAGSYQWRVCYEVTDRTGRVHRSAPSEPVTVVAVALDQVTLTIPTLRLTAKGDVRIVVYRTLVDETTFYRVSSISSPTLNSTTTDTVSFVDGASDVSIAGNDFLYTTGDVLENIAPESNSIVCTYRGRMFLAGHSDPLRVSYSKRIVEGEPVEFSDLLSFHVDAAGGRITAMQAMDDKLIVFKEHSVYVVAGNGPTNTGDSADYGDPVLVSSEVGSIGPIVTVTSAGLMFRSSKGIYLLDRSLQTRYIGDRVEGYNELTVTGAASVPDTNQIRVTHRDGRTLVYDYQFDQWATFTGISYDNVVDCDVWSGSFAALQSDGTVYVEDSSSYTDGTEAVEMRLVTGWIAMANLLGFQRVQRLLVLGDYKSTHKLRVKVGFDYSPNWIQDKLIDAGSILGSNTYGSQSPYGSEPVYGGTFGRYKFNVHLARQKCTSMRFCLQDEETSAAPGEGLTLTAISLLVAQKQGTAKVAAARRF